MPSKHSQHWQTMQWRTITPSIIGRVQRRWTTVNGTAKDVPLKPGTSIQSSTKWSDEGPLPAVYNPLIHLSNLHTHTDFLDIPFHDSTGVWHVLYKHMYIHFTLLHINGTASGAMSPNLCKVDTSPFTAAVRRPVCTYVPQSQFMKRINTFYTHLVQKESCLFNKHQKRLTWSLGFGHAWGRAIAFSSLHFRVT